MTHDLPPHEPYVTHSQQNSPAKRKHLHAYGQACAEAAIAPYKAEIERLILEIANAELDNGEYKLRAEKAEAENANLRKLLEQVAEETAPWTKTLMSTEWGKDCRAALKEKP